ncbi:transmembrane sensor, putative [Methylophaga aminisulfidivorans MP]|uniref:Transmembrane sensor, putative n=1 Tax=Methylophaga aminisulfidivorans MP TaxID=1026882 RepID=F5SWB7_9GAMM|nr:FecR domain-containing protein [Methylophaga aminisulfidivorans]EGL55364.1 transmembrane sensor, putative [Methylophaga aminisulfidivorans MP]
MARSNKDAIYEATNWFVELTSGEATDADQKQWQRWLNASPENRHAWEQVEAITNCFMGLDSKTSITVLNRPIDTKDIKSQERRQVIKTLSLMLAAGSAGWYGYKQKPWYLLMSDYSTAVGEIKRLTLEDGSLLVLNTDTKVAIDFNDRARTIRLLQGEIYIETAQEQDRNYRPFSVVTDHGTVTALGTKFSTRLKSKHSSVSVYQDAVEVRPCDDLDNNVVVNAGELVTFNTAFSQQKKLIDRASMAWINGFIIADKMSLADFVDHLSRYHSGIIRCDPAVADLTISGAFPVNDINAALTSTSEVLSIRIERYTRYFVMIKPA